MSRDVWRVSCRVLFCMRAYQKYFKNAYSTWILSMQQVRVQVTFFGFLNKYFWTWLDWLELESKLVREALEGNVFVSVQRISKQRRLRCCNPYDAVKLWSEGDIKTWSLHPSKFCGFFEILWTNCSGTRSAIRKNYGLEKVEGWSPRQDDKYF